MAESGQCGVQHFKDSDNTASKPVLEELVPPRHKHAEHLEREHLGVFFLFFFFFWLLVLLFFN